MKKITYLLFSIMMTAQAQQKGFIVLKDEKHKIPEGTERRLALVIGNKDYTRPDAKLKNPINDANDMAVVLEKLGFKVLKYTNLSQKEMIAAINDFGTKLANYDVGLFYYSGHGMQFEGENYLVPVDAKILTYSDAESENIKLDKVLGKFKDSKIKTSLVFLDACRNNPFPKSSKKGEIAQGFVKPNNPAGSVVVFATDEGSTADDNINARNGLFTQELIKQILIPNLSLSDIVINTRNQVLDKSNESQEPAEYSTLRGQFYFIKTQNQESTKSDAQIKFEIEEGQKAYNANDYDLAFKLLFKNKDSYLFDASSQNSLGRMYVVGLGIEKNYAEALKWFQKAVSQGNAYAQNNLGNMYQQGQGVEKNDKEAIKWYKKAAEQGDSFGQYNLGRMYLLEKDYKETLKWYQKAAEQGFDVAQYDLGTMYLKGLDVEKDYKEALKWLKKSSDQGNAQAQYNLGYMYRLGLEVEKDDIEAMKWFQKAAEQSNAKSQNAIGTMYHLGTVAGWGHGEAAKWYQKAAEQGLSDAQYNLGTLYETGNGVSKSRKKAIELYKQSAKQGCKDAQDALKRLNQTW